MKKLLIYWRTLRHFRLRQLGVRIRLMLKRKFMVRIGGYFDWPVRRLIPGKAPQLAKTLPMPLFPARADLLTHHDGGLYSLFSNHKWKLSTPVDWHPPELEVGTRLRKIHLHSMEYLEGLDDPTFTELVKDWIVNNPPYRSGYWLDYWNSFALSIRTVVWMQQIANRRSKLSSATTEMILLSLYRQLKFLVRNLEKDIGGNHLIKNTKALLWAGRFFSGRCARKWYGLGERLLLKQLPEQILSDGMHYERSPAYHLQVFADLLECYHVIEPGDTQEALAVTLDRMAQVGADTCHPDGYVSLFNDGGMHMTYLPETCLDVYAKLRSRNVVPKEKYALQESGYYGIRQGDNLFLLDCGPIGPDYLLAHGHGDILAFEWTVGGRRIFIDAGVYEYNAGARRAYARSTCAHNTVTIDDLDQCEFWQAFRVGHRANVSVLSFQPTPGGFLFEGSHDGYHYLTGHPIHNRRVVASPRRIEVVDTITGGAGQTVRARLLCHPECRLEKIDENTLHIERDDIQIGLKTSHSISIAKALWFPDFGVSIDTHQITIHYEPAPCKGRFILEEILS